MQPMESNGHMDWLPGLGTQSHSFSNLASAPRANLETGLNTKAANGALDEVQYSIVCYDCGKHFWRRSTADSHAALTAHVLHEDVISPSSPVIVPSSPTISWDSAHRTKASLSSATDAETSVNTDVIDQGDTEDIGGEEYPVCFECGRYFSSYEAASNHARIGHMQDLEMILSSLPDGSPISTATNPAVTPTFPATASPHAIRGIAPTSPSWTTEHTSSRGFSPTSPNDSEDDFPTSTYEISSRTSDDAMALFQELYALPTTPNSQLSRTENDDNLRRSSGVSPSPSASGSHSRQDVSHSMNAFSPNATASPSPSSSCATLEHPQVIFPRELSDRIFFIVTPSGNRRGPSFIMGLAEAQDPVTFRTGVRDRLESQGEQVGLREIVAFVPWLPVPVYVATDEDHYHMLMIVRSWPEWQKTNGNTSCHIFVTLDDEKDKEGEE